MPGEKESSGNYRPHVRMVTRGCEWREIPKTFQKRMDE